MFFTKQSIGLLILFFGIIFYYPFIFENKAIFYFFGNSHLTDAVIFHAIMFFCMITGYLIPISKYRNQRINFANKLIEIDNKFFYASYLLIIIGLVSVVYSATYRGGIYNYLESIIFFKYAAIRGDFELSSKQGGVSGLIKIWGCAPFAVFLTVSSVKFIFNISSLSKKNKHKLNTLFIISSISIVIKTLFSLDRQSLIGAMIVFLYISIKQKKIKFIFICAILLVIADIFSRYRLYEGGGINFYMQLYPRLGLENLQLLIDSTSGHSYGFNSFLHPISFITSRLGWELIEKVDYTYVWNPAQYLFGFFYIDFGYLSGVPCFLLGLFLGYAQNKSNIGIKQYQLIHFHLLYCVISFAGVPAIRGLEFWFGIFFSLYLANFLYLRRSGILQY